MKKHYYAGHCNLGRRVAFSHWWNVYAFDSKKARDEFVEADWENRAAVTRKEMQAILGNCDVEENYVIDTKEGNIVSRVHYSEVHRNENLKLI